jgi:hypothetical protein
LYYMHAILTRAMLQKILKKVPGGQKSNKAIPLVGCPAGAIGKRSCLVASADRTRKGTPHYRSSVPSVRLD